MPTQPTSQVVFGGVSSFDNPAAFRRERSTRCRNWVPQQNGSLRARFGYTLVSQSTTTVGDIHTAAYVELWNQTKSILFSQAAALKSLALASGTVTSVATLSNSNRWGYFRSNNKTHLSNGTDFKSWDDTTLRNNGIRAPNSTETSGVAVSTTTVTAGSFSTTTLSGYQLYLAYFNPATNHVGNRAKIGNRQTVVGSGISLLVTGLPDISGVDSEWVRIIGRTPDGGETPYWFTDTSGNRLTFGSTASTATVTFTDVDFFAELPIRNSVGSGFIAFTKVLGRVFAIKANDPNIYYSEAEEDSVSGFFIGRPEESWPANNAERFPSNEPMVGVHTYEFEGWFFSKNHVGIWSEYLRQQLTDPWRGIWRGGLAGQRCFTATKRGPFWLSGSKEILTWGPRGPVSVSTEYQKALLNGISDSTLANAELAWEEDPQLEIDRLILLGSDGTRLIVHDFKLGGQGYEQQWANATVTTLVGSGYTPDVPLRDSNGRIRQWAGNSAGRFMQLNDGVTDNGATFTADYASGPISLGFDDPRIVELEAVSDENLRVFGSFALSESLADWQEANREVLHANDSISAYKISNQGRFMRLRFLLDTQTGQNYDLSDPAHAPLNAYGLLARATLKTARSQPQGR